MPPRPSQEKKTFFMFLFLSEICAKSRVSFETNSPLFSWKPALLVFMAPMSKKEWGKGKEEGSTLPGLGRAKNLGGNQSECETG